MKKIFEAIVVTLVVYTIGIAIWLVRLLLQAGGRIKILNPQDFPKGEQKLLIVSNHPDLLDCMYEIFLMPSLLMPRALIHPLKITPWFTPDKRNFTDKIGWAWLKCRAIPIMRAKAGRSYGAGTREAREMFKVLALEHAIMIPFSEGGRTNSGRTWLYSKTGRRIRPLKESAGWLALRTGASVLTVWLEEGDSRKNTNAPKNLFSWPRFKRGPIKIRFGKLMRAANFGDLSATDLTKVIQQNLLALADEE